MTIEATPEGVRLYLHVQPGASRSEVVGHHGDAIKVRLAAPPIDGRANDALCRYLAKCLGVKRQDVRLVRGAASRAKCVAVRGIDRATALERLQPGGTA